MKVLIIPDVHCRKFWRQAIADNVGNVNKVIFLGDYLDPYPDEIDSNPQLMEVKSFKDSFNALNMLNDIISLKKNEPDKYVLLTGNHTDSYIWSKFSAATRTDYDNWEKYHKFFSENLEYFNLVWIEDDVIFSHAGISEDWADEFLYHYMDYDTEVMLEKNSPIFETVRVLKDTQLKDFNIHYIKAISNISYYRRGDSPYGSCEWADIREYYNNKMSGFSPVAYENCFQVFGHTQLKKPLIEETWACLDCRKGFIIDTLTHEINES